MMLLKMLLFFLQKQFHSQIDDLIEESVRDMIQLLVAKVILYIQLWQLFITFATDQKKVNKPEFYFLQVLI